MRSRAQAPRKSYSHLRDENPMPSIHLRAVLLSALVLAGCTTSTNSNDTNGGSGGGGNASSSPAGGSGGPPSSVGEHAGGAASSGAAGLADGATGGATSAGEGSGGTKMFPPGPPGCGLEQAAFCETFDAPAGAKTRAG